MLALFAACCCCEDGDCGAGGSCLAFNGVPGPPPWPTPPGVVPPDDDVEEGRADPEGGAEEFPEEELLGMLPVFDDVEDGDGCSIGIAGVSPGRG